MKTRHMILLYAGALGLLTLGILLHSISGLLPSIAVKVLWVMLVLSTIACALLLYWLYSHFHRMRHDNKSRRLEIAEREQRMRIEAEQHELEMLAMRADVHVKLSRVYADPNGNYPALLPGRFDMQPSQIRAANEMLLLPPGQLRGMKPREPGQDDSSRQDETDVVPTAPTFRAMCHLIRGSAKLPLCYGHTGAILGTVDDLLSMAVTGKPGRGKTTALMYYVAILLACGAEVVIWDPHGAMADLAQLNNRRLPNMPETARVYYFDRKEDIIASLPMLEQNLQDRDDYYRRTKQAKHPHLLLADELPVLADYDEELARGTKRGDEPPSLIKVIRRYVLEARKWRCYFIGSGQSMDAEILPTRVTENLSSRIVFFSSDRRARMAGLENEAIKKYLPIIRRAGSGVMVFDCARFDEPVLGAIPMITIEDLMEFLGLSVESRNLEEMEALQPRDGYQSARPALYTSQQNTFQQDWDSQTEAFYNDSGEENVVEGKVLVFPENAANRPLERPDLQTGEGPKQYRFTETEIVQFVAAYKVVGNIEKVLSSMKKGSGYKPHARELIQAYGLRQNA